MTPASVVTAARRKYNALTDTDFFAEAELYEYLFRAETELAYHADCIEDTVTSTSTTGTSQYTIPTSVYKIKRLTYDGAKLKPIDFRQDDLLTGSDSDTTAEGTPQYYVYFDDKVELRPTPNAAQTLQWRVYKEPSIHTSATTFISPTRYHMAYVDFIVSEMHAKEKNLDSAQYYRTIWERHKAEARRIEKRLKRGDSFASVLDEDSLQGTLIGPT